MKQIFFAFFLFLGLVSMTNKIFAQTIGPSSNPIRITQINDSKISNLMKKAFYELRLDPTSVARETGVSSYSESAFDFINISKVEKEGETEIAYTANYLFSPTNETIAFAVYSNNGVMSRPMIVKGATNKSKINYYDLSESISLTVNYNNQTNQFSSSIGNLNLNTIKNLNSTIYYAKKSYGCGQCVSNCMIDTYSNHGWASVWATIQSTFMPQTIVGIALGCTAKCCIPH